MTDPLSSLNFINVKLKSRQIFKWKLLECTIYWEWMQTACQVSCCNIQWCSMSKLFRVSTRKIKTANYKSFLAFFNLGRVVPLLSKNWAYRCNLFLIKKCVQSRTRRNIMHCLHNQGIPISCVHILYLRHVDLIMPVLTAEIIRLDNRVVRIVWLYSALSPGLILC